MEMDVPADIRAPDDATLDLYCDRVASAVGRLSVRVFGLPEDDGIALAHHLGRALQLTNILRDIDEDAGIGRLYLPREGLHCTPASPATDPLTVMASPALPQVCAPLVARRAGAFRPKPTRSWTATRAASCGRRGSCRNTITPILELLDRARLRSRRAIRSASARHRAIVDPPALRVHLMPKTVHIIGAGLSGLSAAVRLAEAGCKVHVHEATQQAGGRCRSYFDAATDLIIDNGNHLLLSGNHRRAVAYARSIGTEAGLVGPERAEFPFVDLETVQRWTLDLGDGRLPLWVFDESRRVPGTQPARLSGVGAADLGGRRADWSAT